LCDSPSDEEKTTEEEQAELTFKAEKRFNAEGLDWQIASLLKKYPRHWVADALKRPGTTTMGGVRNTLEEYVEGGRSRKPSAPKRVEFDSAKFIATLDKLGWRLEWDNKLGPDGGLRWSKTRKDAEKPSPELKSEYDTNWRDIATFVQSSHDYLCVAPKLRVVS
jgi:hypothetical protein